MGKKTATFRQDIVTSKIKTEQSFKCSVRKGVKRAESAAKANKRRMTRTITFCNQNIQSHFSKCLKT